MTVVHAGNVLTTRRRVELSCVSEVCIATPMQLNSTSSCRHVHSVNNSLSTNVVTQLTQFVGRDVINKNTTDLAVHCSTGSVEFSSVELSCVIINTPLHCCLVDGATIYKYIFISLMMSKQNRSHL